MHLEEPDSQPFGESGSMRGANTPPSLAAGGTLTILFVATFTIMVGCVVVPALPVIAAHLGLQKHSAWLVTLPSLGVVLFGPLAGLAANRNMSARSTMLAGLLAYGILGVAAPLLSAYPWLVLVDRVLLGGATAILMASGGDLIAIFYRGEARIRMIAWQSMATEGGGIVLMALGGVLGELHWQLPFALYALAFVCFFCGLATIPQQPTFINPKTTAPLVNSSRIAVVLLSACFSMLLLFVAVLTLPGLLAVRFNYGAAKSGYLLSYISLCSVLAVLALPVALRHIRPGLLQATAFLLYGVSHLVLAKSSSVFRLLVGGLIMGMAFALSLPVATHLLIDLSSAKQRARNLGYLSTFIFLGQVFSSFSGYISGSGERVMLVAGATGFVLAIVWWIHQRMTPTSEPPFLDSEDEFVEPEIRTGEVTTG